MVQYDVQKKIVKVISVIGQSTTRKHRVTSMPRSRRSLPHRPAAQDGRGPSFCASLHGVACLQPHHRARRRRDPGYLPGGPRPGRGRRSGVTPG